jgi:hypothetical protein
VKIRELLEAGTRLIWVVRPVGPRRVEVYRAGEPMRRFASGEVLEAPGILRNPVEVDALFEPAAADRAVLRNLLQRAGYDGLDAVRAEGREEGREEGERGLIHRLIERRFGALDAVGRARIEGLRGESLAALGEAILELRDLADLADWLATRGSEA